jgi:hypothetical protein
MRGVRWVGLVAVAACYAPSTQPGSPCDPGVCPPGLVCSPATHTCERAVIDAATGIDTGDGPMSIDAAPAAWLAGYGYRKQITIHAPADTSLSDFPVSVALVDPDLAQHASADGSDIVFTAADGTTRLHDELVSYEPLTGTLDAWAQTSLPAAGTVAIFIYFGGDAATRVSPWSSKFAGVWHMDGTADTIVDSVAGHQVMAPTAAQAAALVPGKAGAARGFDGVDDTMSCPDPTDGSLDFGLGSFSYEIWVNVTTNLGPYDTPFFKGGASATQVGYNYELGTGAWTSHLADGVATQSPAFGTETTLTGAWHHLAIVVDRTPNKVRAYTDGSQVAMSNLTLGAIDSTQPLIFSRPTDLFDGVLDEARVYRVALDAEWIATEYANIANRGAFMTVGALEQHAP